MLCRISATCLLFFATVSVAPAFQVSKLGDAKPPELKVTDLTLSPKAADREALRYRLLPLGSERTPGDAVPIYLRLGAVQQDSALKEINDKSTPWLDVPIAELPVPEVRKFVEMWSSKLRQMDFAARRQTSHWNYTLAEEREEMTNILLPDAQEMRTWARLLAIKARLEIAEKNYPSAIRSIETGLSMGRQLAEAPFLINGLVGIAVENQFLSRVEELISQPDAPNLYWSLTALPRPLVDLRNELETEQIMGTCLMPELIEPTGPRSESEWSSLLVRLQGRWSGLSKMLDANGEKKTVPPPSLAGLLAEAKTFFKEREISTDGMGDDQITLRYIAAFYREMRDETFRASYLPYVESLKFHKAAEAKHKAATGPVAGLFAEVMPAITAVRLTQARLDRRIAALRAIEALRMQAAADGGKFPESLDKVTIVPVPNDPLSGQPFFYKVHGDSASLTVPVRVESDPGLAFGLTLRKSR